MMIYKKFIMNMLRVLEQTALKKSFNFKFLKKKIALKFCLWFLTDYNNLYLNCI